MLSLRTIWAIIERPVAKKKKKNPHVNPEIFITYSKSGVAYLKDTTVTTGLT